MAKAKTLAVDGRLVKWARESAGLSLEVAAKKAKVRPAIFAEWERTRAYRTPRQLESLADAFKRPVASFFLPEPPREPSLPADFRLAQTDNPPSFSFETRLAIRRARRLQRIYSELVEELGSRVREPERLGPLSIRRKESPEAAATRARSALGITIEEQTAWRDTAEALRAWRARIEAQHVLVFQFAMNPDEVSGFSISSTPVVVLNKKDAPVRRIFTLAHEWAHLLLGEPGLCNVDEARIPLDESVEVYCNAFAAALLLPLEDFKTSAPAVAFSERRASLEAAVDDTARLFAVSRVVALRRFLTAEAITRETYQRMADKWRRERRRPTTVKKSRGPLPHTLRGSELGTPFISRVLAAHERGLVSDADVADYLSLRLKHLAKLQERYASG